MYYSYVIYDFQHNFVGSQLCSQLASSLLQNPLKNKNLFLYDPLLLTWPVSILC